MRHPRPILALALPAAPLSPPLAARALQVADPAKELLGVWQCTDDERRFVRFEATRCAMLHDGRLSAWLARYEPGAVELNAFGVRIRWKAELKGEGLRLTTQETTRPYRRVDAVPRDFEPKPMVLPRQKPLKRDRVKEIQAALAERERSDQAVRNDPMREKEQDKVDAENTAYLVSLVKEVGWIDAKRFGPSAATAAWLLAVHSGDLPFMLAALPEIEKDVKSKVLPNGENYANLFDRVRILRGERQRYGTQIGQDDRGEFVVLPLENRAQVDVLRKEIGLPPLARSLEKHKQWTGGKAVSIQDE